MNLLACSVVQSVCELTFRRNVSSPFLEQKISRARNQCAESCLAACCTMAFCSADFRPWRWRWYFPPKSRFAYGLHDAIFQKMATFIVSLFSTLNLDKSYCRLTCIHHYLPCGTQTAFYKSESELPTILPAVYATWMSLTVFTKSVLAPIQIQT
jgi:hypothetical protein